MPLFKRNPFGHILFIKKWIIRIVGVFFHSRFSRFNNLKIEGSEIIRNLPEKNVLFISNHQTYFADVIAMFHVFNAALKGRDNTLKNVGYLWNPKLNFYFIAAGETMRSGIVPKIFGYAGSVSVERTWRSKGEDINRQVRMSDVSKIGMALEDGWVVTFPQGTTTAFKPIRRGTAHLIKKYKPVVVPVVIDGFRRSFDKKGLKIKKRSVLQSMVIKPPLTIDYEHEEVADIITKIEYAIEQHPSFLKVLSVKELEKVAKQEKALEEKRKFWD